MVEAVEVVENRVDMAQSMDMAPEMDTIESEDI